MPTPPTHHRPVYVAVLNDYPIVIAGLAHVMQRYPARIRVVEVGWLSAIPDGVDVVLYDMFAGDTDDVRRLPDLVNRTSARVVVYAGSMSEGSVAAARRAGVAACLSKRASIEELLATLEAVQRSEPVGAPDFGDGEAPGVGTWPGRTARLSSREAEVLAYIARGYTNEQIASALFLSINSIKTYIRSAYRKIGVERRTQAVLWGMENGFVTAARRPDDQPDLTSPAQPGT